MMKSRYLRYLPSEKISFRVSNETSEAMSLNSGGITISSIRKIEGLPLASLPFIFILMIFLSLDENGKIDQDCIEQRSNDSICNILYHERDNKNGPEMVQIRELRLDQGNDF